LLNRRVRETGGQDTTPRALASFPPPSRSTDGRCPNADRIADDDAAAVPMTNVIGR